MRSRLLFVRIIQKLIEVFLYFWSLAHTRSVHLLESLISNFGGS